MSNETMPTNIEIIRNKLKKYTHLKENRKVRSIVLLSLSSSLQFSFISRLGERISPSIA